MSTDDEDEALTWAGGRDPSHYETPEAKAPKALRPSKPPRPSKTQSVAAEVDSTTTEDDDLNGEPAGSGAVVLVSLGILAGIYLLYTIGWFVSWQRFVYSSSDALELIAFHVQQVLAILAPPLWFALTVTLTRERRPIVRLLWLLAGALALIPWPFVFGS